MTEFKDTLEMRQFIETMNKKPDVPFEFFEQCALNNNDYLVEGIFGQFGKWVKNKLGIGNSIDDPAEFAKIEAKVRDSIINKYEGIPIDKIRIIVPVGSSSDLEEIAKNGPSKEMIRDSIMYGKLATDKFKKNVLKPSDYRAVKKGYKYAALIDVPNDHFKVVNSIMDIDRSVLKKGVWGAIILGGMSFEEMIPASVLGVDPAKTSLNVDGPGHDDPSKEDETKKEEPKPDTKPDDKKDEVKVSDVPKLDGSTKPTETKEEPKKEEPKKEEPKPSEEKKTDEKDMGAGGVDLGSDFDVADVSDGASDHAKKTINDIMGSVKSGKLTGRDLSKLIIMIGRVEKAVRNAGKKSQKADSEE